MCLPCYCSALADNKSTLYLKKADKKVAVLVFLFKRVRACAETSYALWQKCLIKVMDLRCNGYGSVFCLKALEIEPARQFLVTFCWQKVT